MSHELQPSNVSGDLQAVQRDCQTHREGYARRRFLMEEKVAPKGVNKVKVMVGMGCVAAVGALGLCGMGPRPETRGLCTRRDLTRASSPHVSLAGSW